jgi:hypothetical protein
MAAQPPWAWLRSPCRAISSLQRDVDHQRLHSRLAVPQNCKLLLTKDARAGSAVARGMACDHCLAQEPIRSQAQPHRPLEGLGASRRHHPTLREPSLTTIRTVVMQQNQARHGKVHKRPQMRCFRAQAPLTPLQGVLPHSRLPFSESEADCLTLPTVAAGPHMLRSPEVALVASVRHQSRSRSSSATMPIDRAAKRRLRHEM